MQLNWHINFTFLFEVQQKETKVTAIRSVG